LQCTHAKNAYLKKLLLEEMNPLTALIAIILLKKMPAKLMAGKSNREVICQEDISIAKIREEILQHHSGSTPS
jgi:hypothetical protein